MEVMDEVEGGVERLEEFPSEGVDALPVLFAVADGVVVDVIDAVVALALLVW